MSDLTITAPTIALLGVPSAAGAHSPGQEKAPKLLRGAGLAERLLAEGLEVDDLGDLAVEPAAVERDARMLQTAARAAAVAHEVAARIGGLDDDETALVIGGDCTILVGVVAGVARRAERVGVVYLDAHTDLNTPASTRQGALDWMGVAHLLGEPSAANELSEIGPRFPLLADQDIIFVGTVGSELTRFERQTIERRGLRVISAGEVRADPGAAARRATAALLGRVDRFVVHFDLDVVDYVDFPFSDNPYRRNDGLLLTDAFAVVGELARQPGFTGLVVTEINPDHAVDAAMQAKVFTEGLALVLSGQTEAARVLGTRTRAA